MPRRAMPLAVNPLPWINTPDGWQMNRQTLTQALKDLSGVGYKAIHAEVPADMTVADYRSLIAEYGFVPAPGYFSANFATQEGEVADEESPHERVERARRAAGVQAALGLDTMFIASAMAIERKAVPAVGHLADDDRIRRIADGLVAAAEVMRAEGVTAAIHPHVGTWVEVESEVRAVLDHSAGSALQFGPDTGHLQWAGADPVALVTEYADRVACLHLKDVDAQAMRAAAAAKADYLESTFDNHVWTEPGRGAVDFAGVIDALPEEFGGWAVIEVDVPNLPDRVASARVSLEYATSAGVFDPDPRQ